MGINPLPLQGTNQPSTRAKEGRAPANSYHHKEQTGTHPTPIHPILILKPCCITRAHNIAVHLRTSERSRTNVTKHGHIIPCWDKPGLRR